MLRSGFSGRKAALWETDTYPAADSKSACSRGSAISHLEGQLSPIKPSWCSVQAPLLNWTESSVREALSQGGQGDAGSECPQARSKIDRSADRCQADLPISVPVENAQLSSHASRGVLIPAATASWLGLPNARLCSAQIKNDVEGARRKHRRDQEPLYSVCCVSTGRARQRAWN